MISGVAGLGFMVNVNRFDKAGLLIAQESFEKILQRNELLPVAGFR